jgi:Bacterial Ig-like domain (group 1)
MRYHPGTTRYLSTSAFLFLLSCGGGDLTLPGGTSPPTDLVVVSGDEQSAEPGDDLPEPLVVKVVDAQENPVANAAVSWEAGGGGSVSPEAAQTDDAGLASARVTLGADEGVYTVSAAVTGLEAVTFTASADNGGRGGGGGPPTFPYRLEIVLQPTVAFAGQRFTPPLVVAVTDENGMVVRDFKTKIEIVLAAGSGSLEGKREQDTKDGTATFTDLKLDEIGLGKVLRASAPKDPFVGAAESAPFAVIGFDDDDDDDE